ncbi:tripartite tricarboxylate transporter substrate-binding protein [Cupriavidus nantongensis]|uniref:tripartite tricarboxylate transporter substrate-binding protein n=1 Tax=Cupriavidus nantongensis TaxID=1796606 RepID=UPI003AAD65AF
MRADAAYKTAEDLLNAAKAAPGKLKASGTGQGGIWHLGLAQWLVDNKAASNAIAWVPSQGAAPGLQDLLAGGVDVVSCSLPEARALIEGGKVKPLVLMGAKPDGIFPKVPLYKDASGKMWNAGITVGNPRNEGVRMGSLVSRAQLDAVREGLESLKAQAEVLHDGSAKSLVDADPAIAACIGPVLLGARDADAADRVHDVEVFGPVATLLPYRDLDHAMALAHRGQGSLVTSLYGADDVALGLVSVQLAASHGRVHVITPDVAQAQTGHGNVMPMSLHGGPGRAGGGAELGGLRALDFYHRRSAVQASPNVIAKLGIA